MTVTRAHLMNPLPAHMELLDLHIGVVSRPGNDDRLVALMLQPSDALLTEEKVGTVLTDWPAVIEVLAGLVDQSTEAWGTMPTSLRHEELLLLLGELTGALTLGPHRERLTQQVREGKLKAGYVTLLRDQLSRVLRESGIEREEARQ